MSPRSRSAIPVLLLLAFSGALPGVARASLIGADVTVTNRFKGFVFDGPTEVGVSAEQVELFDFGGDWDIDFDADGFTMIFRGAAEPIVAADTYEFSGLGWGDGSGAWTRVALSGTGNIGAFDFENEVTGPDSLVLTRKAGSAFGLGDRLAVILIVDGSVPEPGLLGLMASALALGGARVGRRPVADAPSPEPRVRR